MLPFPYRGLFSLIVALALSLGATPAAFGDSPQTPVAPVNSAGGVGLKGYDAVAYFSSGKPTLGLDQYSYTWKGTIYRFASAAHLESFKADPRKYLPQYGGYCAYAISIDRIADIDPSRWAIVDGKLYLNNNFFSQSLWSLNKSARIISGDRNWAVYPKTTQAN
jgi:YHS domain-containing protein